MAHAGIREWSVAHQYLDQAAALARGTGNKYVELFGFAARLRTLAQQGLHARALGLPEPPLEGAIAAIRSEVLASRALALAGAGRLEEAEGVLVELESSTSIEPVVLCAAVELALVIKRGARVAPERIAALEELAFATGAMDLLIASYRAVPELLLLLVRLGPSKRLTELIHKAGDDDLLRPLNLPGSNDLAQLLTKREREVYELVCQSFTNRQIADTLFISESTAKLHVHHILKKMGVRSRQALIIQAALKRSGQATSATGDSSAAA
jgi:DNA-binding NarL/FixJ family response regulator